MSASSEIAGGKDENDFVDGVEDSQNGVHKKRKQKKHILPNMEQHKYHKLKKKYALLERSMAKLRHHVKKLEKENDKLRANFLDLQQSSAEVIQRKDDRIQELTDQVQQYISRLQTSQLIQHRDQTRRLSHDLGHRGHHSQSPDDRGNLRHAGTRREKRTRGASSERGDSREKRRREDEHHIRHRQTEVVTRQRSRLGDSAGVSSRGHRDHQPYRSSSQHSASPHDKRPSESHTQSPVAAGAPYRSDHDLRTSRVHHNREGDREHGRSRNVSSRSSGKKQGRDSSDSRVNTRDKSLPQEELPVDQPEAAGEVKEGSRQQLGISDQERMRAYISLAQKRTLVQQIAFKNSQKLRNRMIADYTSRSADHADFIASLPKARDKETNADSSDSERSCRSRVSTFDDGNLFADLTAFDDDVVAKSAYTTLVTTQSVSPLGSIETPVKDEHLTNPEPFAERSVNVVNEITGQTDMCMSGRVDTKQDSMSSQEMLIMVASADICNSRVDSTGYGNTGAIRTKREVSETNTHNTKVAQDATAPLSMLLSVLFGKAMSSPVSAAGMTRVALTTGESAENTTKECSTLDSLPHTGLTVVRNLQQVPAVTCVPSAIVPPYQARDLKCAGTIQRTDEIVIDISKHNATSVTRNVERSMGDVKMGKTESLDDVKSGKKESLDNVTRNNTKSCNAKPSKTESFGDVTPGKTVSVQNVADTTNDSETNESGIRIVEESANSSISRKDVRHCADPDRGNNSLRSSGKRHTSKHKTSSRTDRNTADCSSSTRTLQSSGRETGERTEENNVVIPTDDPERATFVSDCLTTDSCCSQPDRTVAETCPVKPAETNIDAVFSDDDEDDDASDFAFVIDTNVSPVSSDIDDSSVSRKDEDLWDVSLQSDNKNDRGHSTPAGSQCGEHGELAGRTDGTRSNDGSTVGRTHAVAARADVPKARLHVRDPRRVVKSRDQRRPDSATSRRRSSNDDSKVRSTPCAKSKPSSLVSLSKVELSDGSKKTRRLSDQHRRRQKESRENRRPILQHNRPQKNDTRRQSESRNVEGGTSPTTRKAKCQNGHIAPSASVTKIHGARKEIRPVKSVSAQHDHRTAVSGSDMRAHRARDAVKKPLASDGTPPNKRAPHARADLKNKLLASGGDSSNKTPHRSRDDLTSGGFPPNKSAHEAHDDKKNQHLTTGGTARNKSANRARDELKNHSLTSGGTPPNKSAHHGRYDFKKNCVTSDESAPNKTTPSVRDDFKNALANDESPCTKAVVNDILSIAIDKDTPARSENPCVAETRDDSMEEGEILSDEDPGSASDVTVKRRVVDPRSSSDGVHRTHSHGTNRDHVPRRKSLHSTSTKH